MVSIPGSIGWDGSPRTGGCTPKSDSLTYMFKLGLAVGSSPE